MGILMQPLVAGETIWTAATAGTALLLTQHFIPASELTQLTLHAYESGTVRSSVCIARPYFAHISPPMQIARGRTSCYGRATLRWSSSSASSPGERCAMRRVYQRKDMDAHGRG